MKNGTLPLYLINPNKKYIFNYFAIFNQFFKEGEAGAKDYI